MELSTQGCDRFPQCAHIHICYGSELMAKAMDKWAFGHGFELDFS